MKPRTEVYVSHYLSPSAICLILADENGLKGLWFEIQKDCVNAVDASHILAEEPFEETKRWLDAYIEGLQPDFTPKFQLDVTPLKEYVYNEIIKLPYGKTATYTEIADRVAKNNNFKTKPQSVGALSAKIPSPSSFLAIASSARRDSSTDTRGDRKKDQVASNGRGGDLSNFSIPNRSRNFLHETQALRTIR